MTRKKAQTLLFIAYLTVLLRLTVFRNGCFTHGLCTGEMNLVPGRAYFQLLSWRSYRAAAYLFFGNILCFVPLGLYLACRGWDLPACLLAGLLLSLAIEGGQYVLGCGVTEADDVLLNTLGTMAGWGIKGPQMTHKA